MNSVKLSVIHVPELAHATPNLNKSRIIQKYSSVPVQQIEVKPTQSELDKILNGPYLISTHAYVNGDRRSENWQGCEVLFLDFDSKDHPVTPDQIIPRLSGLNYYLNYSNGHNPESGLVKFHLYLPLNSGISDAYEYASVWEAMKLRFPEMDTSCGDLARFSFRGNSKFLSRFDGDQQDLNVQLALAELAEHKLDKANKQLQEQVHTTASSGHKLDELEIFTLETQVKSDKGSITKLGDLDPEEKPQFLCPICGEKPGRGNPGDHNATYQLSRADGKPIVYCSSCAAEGRGAGGKGVYNLVLDDQHKWIEKKNGFTIFRDVTENRFLDRRYSKAKAASVMSPINREGITNRYARYGVKAPAYFPEYEVRLGFNQDHWLDEDLELVYKYQPTKYLTEALPAGLVKIPPFTKRLFQHVTGHDAACYEYFLDWLAAIVQLRRKLLTSWVLHGVQGTGKGIMMDKVIQPLLGVPFTAVLTQDALESRFNSVFRDSVFIAFNEVQVDFSKNSGNSVNARVKVLITENTMSYEPKGVDARQGENECNFLFFSNLGNAVKIEEGDRRFNVAPRQEIELKHVNWLPPGGIDELKRRLSEELMQFAIHLRQRPYRQEVTYMPLDTDAKLAMIAATRTSGEDFFLKMIKPLDWDLLEENIDYSVGSSRFDSSGGCSVQADAILSMRKQAADGDPIRAYLTNDEITILYNNIVNTSHSDVKKGSVSKKAGAVGMAMSVFRDIHGNPVRGWKI